MATKTPILHSWPISKWPADIYPNDSKKARHLVRSHKNELLREGALVRVGRELVAIGAPYSKWLQKKASRVPGYECPANRARDAA